MQLGDARIVLDAPAGYADTGFTGSPRLQDLAQSLTSASNRILIFAISDDDLRRFSLGDPPEFRRYMLVATPRSLERSRLDAPGFQRLAEDALRALGTPSPTADEDIARRLEARPVGAPTPLRELRREPDLVSFLQGMRLEPTKIPRFFGSDERQNFVVSSSTLLLARGKALHMNVFSVYETAEDAAWVRAMTERWAQQLQRLNGE